MTDLKNAATRWFGRSLDKLKSTEKHVLESAHNRTPIARNTNDGFNAQSSLGDRVADRIAEIGGSWAFIGGFFGFLAMWVVLNTVLLTREAFDPYPFIFLNLVLSMVAAVQAPVIMMSQNRSAKRDRIEASHDYEVNLKAEIEIMALHDKVDALRTLEIAEIAGILTQIVERLERLETVGLRPGIAAAENPDRDVP